MLENIPPYERDEYIDLFEKLAKDKKALKNINKSHVFWSCFYTIGGLIITKNYPTTKKLAFILFFLIPNSFYFHFKKKLTEYRMHEITMTHSLRSYQIKVDDYTLKQFYDDYLYFCYYNKIK
jgi:hypothetical protein